MLISEWKSNPEKAKAEREKIQKETRAIAPEHFAQLEQQKELDQEEAKALPPFESPGIFPHPFDECEPFSLVVEWLAQDRDPKKYLEPSDDSLPAIPVSDGSLDGPIKAGSFGIPIRLATGDGTIEADPEIFSELCYTDAPSDGVKRVDKAFHAAYAAMARRYFESGGMIDRLELEIKRERARNRLVFGLFQKDTTPESVVDLFTNVARARGAYQAFDRLFRCFADLEELGGWSLDNPDQDFFQLEDYLEAVANWQAESRDELGRTIHPPDPWDYVKENAAFRERVDEHLADSWSTKNLDRLGRTKKEVTSYRWVVKLSTSCRWVVDRWEREYDRKADIVGLDNPFDEMTAEEKADDYELWKEQHQEQGARLNMIASIDETEVLDFEAYHNDRVEPFLAVPTAEELAELGRAAGNPFKVYSPAEFADQDFSVDFLVDGVLVADQPCVMAGPSKSLKTSLSVALAVSIATGRPFLGEHEVETPRPVLFLSAESGEAAIKSCLGRICYSLGVEPREVPIYFGSWVPHAKQADKLAALRYWLDKIRPGVVFIDPVYQAIDGSDAANLSLMGEQFATLSKNALHFGATPVLVHHTKKGSANAMERQPLEIHDLAGAGIVEFARQWFLVNRRERFTKSEVNKLWLACGGSAGHASEWAVDVDERRGLDGMPRGWSVEVRDRSEVEGEKQDAREERKERQKEARRAESRTAIANLFRFDSSPKSKTAIRDNCGKSGVSFNEAFTYLVQKSILIHQRGKAGNGKECDQYTFDQEKYLDVHRNG